jgi:hypothetical protein
MPLLTSAEIGSEYEMNCYFVYVTTFHQLHLIMNGEMGITWTDMVVACHKALSSHLSGRLGKISNTK